MGDEELDKAINLLSSVDFDTSESQVGSGQPHMLNDVRNDLSILGKARTDLINSTARLKGGVTGSSMPLTMLTPTSPIASSQLGAVVFDWFAKFAHSRIIVWASLPSLSLNKVFSRCLI